MRKIALVFSLLGLFILLIISFLIGARKVVSKDELGGMKNNEIVTFTGRVVEERYGGKYKLDNGIEFECEKCYGLKNTNVRVYAKVEKYKEKIYLIALKVREKI